MTFFNSRCLASWASLCLLFVLGTSPVSAAPLAYETEVQADNPLLYYRMGEASGTTAVDSSTNAWDGTYVAGPTFSQVGAGAGSDTAVLFDGSSDYIAVTSTADNGAIGASAAIGSQLGAISFEAVFSTTTTSTDYLFGTANTGSTTNFGLGFNENFGGQTRLFLRDDDGVNILGEFDLPEVFNGSFHHLIYTYDATGATNADRMKAYLNGQEVALNFRVSGQPDNFSNSEFPLLVGANNNRGTSHRWFDGTIDELAIYGSVLSATDAFDRFNALGIVVPNQWDVDGGGSFNVATNWLDDVVPVSNALFGTALASGDGVVTLDSAVSLNSVTFNNPDNQYTIAGPSALTLVGDAQVSASGSHVISADVAGTAGLTKVGSGTLTLSGAKSYTGATDVQAGTLQLDDLGAIDNQATGIVNVEPGATVTLAEGATGTLAAQLTGGSSVTEGDATVRINDAVTISRSNAGFGGVIRVDAGTLTVGNSNALGDGGESNDRTVVQSGSTAKVALSGGVTIATELLDFEGRATSDVGLTSSGNNAWNGVIRGEGSDALSEFNIESTSGTLTLATLYAEDSAGDDFNYVFSGAGNTTITGRLSDANIDIGTGIVSDSGANNVSVVKKGTGTLTLAYSSSNSQDYWSGSTTIEEGTLKVSSSDGTTGELRSNSIMVKSGATLDVTDFSTYSQQSGPLFIPAQTFEQAIRGGGSIAVGAGSTLQLIHSAEISPGDTPGAVGELTVTSGNVTLPDLTGASVATGGLWKFDIGNTANPTGDLLNVQAGSFTAGTSAIAFNVTPAYGTLDNGNYTVVSHTGGANSVLNGATAQITDAAGNALTTRQSVAINADTAGQVNVVVSGSEEQSRTWNGGTADWDVATANWQEGDNQFRDLDHVTFDDTAAGTTDVTLADNRSPGSITFANNSKDYTIAGAGSLVTNGPVQVTGTGHVTLATSGNQLGATTINSGSSLQVGSAAIGSLTNNGSLTLGIEETVPLMVQNGAEEIGTGAAYKVFAFEAEAFMTQVENQVGSTNWTVRNDVAGSSGAGASGEALFASEDASLGNPGSALGNHNYVTYDMQFSEPGEYTWFHRMVSVDGGNPGPTADGDPGNDDSFWTVSGDMDAGNADPGALGSRIENFGSGSRVNAEGTNSDAFVYDWYRNAGGNEFDKITVTQADVDAGTVFSFKVGTREGGMTLDKFAFVAIDDVANFGTTLLDADLDAASSIAVSQETFTASGSVLSVAGDFTMAAGADLNMLVSTTGTHDQVDVAGLLTAAGTLNLAPGGNGFSVSVGDVFDLFTFDSASGSFTIGSLPTLAAGLDWDTSGLDGSGAFTGLLSVIESLVNPGDYNGDNLVDARDYAVWRENLGGTLPFNDSTPGVVDSADLQVWLDNYGTNYGGGASPAQAPEPSALVGLILVVSLTATRRRKVC